MLLQELFGTAPGSFKRLFHFPAPQSVMFGTYVRGFMSPIFKKFTISRGSRNEIARMSTKSREQWQLLTAHQNIDRINLNQSDVVENFA